jgi:integrase
MMAPIKRMGKSMRIFPEGVIMSRDFYVHKRQHGIYYVEFIDKVTGEKMSARSTGETDKVKAIVKAELWKVNGIPTGRMRKPRPIEEAAGIESVIRLIRKSELNSDDALRVVSTLKSMGLVDIAAVKNTGRGAVPFIQFLESFWDFDKSEYIRDRLAHGYRFSRRYARECQNRLKAELVPFFGEKKLNCVTTDDLKKLSNQLSDRSLSTSTINQILLVCCTPLKWAYNEKIIPSNPVIGLTKFSITNKERGILTESEAAAVFAVDWKDKRAFVASLVAATTGARQGECLALRRSDIGGDTIIVAHSYSPLDGLKCPKNGHKRVVPLLPEVRAALLDLLNDNPHTGIDDPFIFFSLQPDKPCDPKVILEGLKEALQQIKVDHKGRNITYHSWRHWFCSKITEKIEGEKVAKVSGHLSENIFKKYADHIEKKNIKDVGNAAAQAFGNVLQFRKVG